MSFKDIQKDVDDWIKDNKGYWPPLSIMAQITEEYGEISKVVEDFYILLEVSKSKGNLARNLNNLYGGRVKKLEDPEAKIGEEISDLMFALICLANSHNIDLEEAWKKTIATRCKRDETRYR